MRLIAFFLMALLCCGQQSNTKPSILTNGCINGRGWLLMEDTEKLLYLKGLEEAFTESGARDTYIARGLTPKELDGAISDLYKDTANLLIPVIRVMPLLAGKVKGASQHSFDVLVSALREEALNAPENKR